MPTAAAMSARRRVVSTTSFAATSYAVNCFAAAESSISVYGDTNAICDSSLNICVPRSALSIRIPNARSFISYSERTWIRFLTKDVLAPTVK